MTDSSSSAKVWRLQVAVATPQHAGLSDTLDYRDLQPLPPGQLLRVPLGRREVLGIVWSCSEISLEEAEALKPIGVVLPLLPLDAGWRQLVQFGAGYYQRGLGEFAITALPAALQQTTPEQLQRRLARLLPKPRAKAALAAAAEPPALNPAQQAAVAAVANSWHYRPRRRASPCCSGA